MMFYEFRRMMQEYVAEPYSEEGQAVINNDETHVSEMWEDGEVTFTKSGDLYGARRTHASSPPLFPEKYKLWEVPDGQDHKKKVIVDDGVKELLDHIVVKVTTAGVEVELDG